jgi:hypothetical protein
MTTNKWIPSFLLNMFDGGCKLLEYEQRSMNNLLVTSYRSECFDGAIDLSLFRFHRYIRKGKLNVFGPYHSLRCIKSNSVIDFNLAAHMNFTFFHPNNTMNSVNQIENIIK